MNSTQTATHPLPSLGIFRFVSELRRRRVCRAATMYSVAMWLVYQVVELVAPELGLPQWTLRFVILIGLLGFPITMILSWLFDITPNGLIADGDDDQRARPKAGEPPGSRLDRVIDSVLICAALVIGTQLAIGSAGPAVAADGPVSQKIVVVPFRVATLESAHWSEGLVIELQHELRSRTDMTVIAPQDPFGVENSLRLTGAITQGPNNLQVTATLIDNDTGVVSWSYKFDTSANETSITPAEIARAIVSLLSGSSEFLDDAEESHGME